MYRIRQRCATLRSRLQDELITRVPQGADETDATVATNLQDLDEAFNRIHAYLKEIRKKQVYYLG